MSSDRSSREGQPLEPQEAREHGNDPDAVRVEDSESGEGGPLGKDSSESDRKAQQEQRSSGRGGSRQQATSAPGVEGDRTDDLNLQADPGQDAGRWRARGPLTETYAQGGHGVRVQNNDEGRDASRETRTQESQRGAGRDTNQNDRSNRSDQDERGTSLPSVIYGWLASLGAFPILFVIIGAIVGGIVALLGLSATAGGIASSVGFLITLFLAFLIGGYVAGRLASRQGAKHGLLVPLLALILVALLAVAGGVLGSTFSDASEQCGALRHHAEHPDEHPPGPWYHGDNLWHPHASHAVSGWSPRRSLGRQDGRAAAVERTKRVSSTEGGKDMGFLVRRLLVSVAPILWRKFREHRQKKEEQ